MGILPRNGRVVRGSARIAGRELIALSERELQRIRGDEIGIIFQDPMTSLNPVLTIGKTARRGDLGTHGARRQGS